MERSCIFVFVFAVIISTSLFNPEALDENLTESPKSTESPKDTSNDSNTSNGKPNDSDTPDCSDTSGYPCLSGVRKFAASQSLSHWWDCPAGAVTATLKKCQSGTWNRKSMMCNEKPPESPGEEKALNGTNKRESGRRDGKAIEGEKENQSPLELFSIPVLGRPVWLGDLYDARREIPLNGFSLWNYDEINKYKLTLNKEYSNTEFFVERSQNDRISKFNIDAELTLSFLGGLIEVGGSANYLKSSKQLSSSMRFNMMYEATTKTETLPMSLKKNTTYNQICENLKNNPDSGPTHVITTIEYGMKAVFTFEKTISVDDSQEELGGSVQVAIKSIPSFSIKGSAKVNLNGTLNKTVTNMEVEMYGDFIVTNPPTDYNSAIDTYREIINTLKPYPNDTGTRKATPAPVRMTLTPIGEFCDTTDLVLAGISAELTQKAIAILVELEDLVLEIKTLEETPLAKKFLDISKILKLFRLKLEIYKLDVQSKLNQILPKLRGGVGEECLSKLLANHINSPFNYDSGIQFLRERERELNSINILFDDKMIYDGSIEVGDYSESNILRALSKSAYVFIYYFNVLYTDEWVTELYLYNKTVDTKTWYNDIPKAAEASNHWREFKSFVNINLDSSKGKDQAFFIKAAYLEENLTEISVYNKGVIQTADFKIPKPPPKPQVESKTHNSVTLLVAKKENIPENEFITEVVVKYGEALDAEYNRTTSIKINKDEEEIRATIEIPFWKEMENTTVPAYHTFITAFQGSFCRGPYSEHLTGVFPLASSKPNLKPVQHINTTFGKLEWEKPDEFPNATLLPLDGYKVNITGGNKFNESVQTKDMEWTFPDLSHFTQYTGSVELIFQDQKMKGETASFEFHTLPSTPGKPSADKVEEYDITLQLTPRNRLEKEVNANFEKYQITYYKLDNRQEVMPATQKEVDSYKATIEISSLSPGTFYEFKYKVVTSKATSEFSPLLRNKTREVSSKLKELNEEMDTREKNLDDQLKSIIPIGSIIPWVNKLDESGDPVVELPIGWQRCDGTEIMLGEFKGEFSPNLNPNKLFLKGGQDEDVLETEEDQIQDHEHNFHDNGHIHDYHEEYNNATDTCEERYLGEDFGIGATAENPKTDHIIETNRSTTRITMGSVKEMPEFRSGEETRPKNMKVIYIMRIF